MNFDEYQKKVREFADYPAGIVNGNEVKLLYPVLGLSEEVGEFFEKEEYLTNTQDVDGIVKELGDICWFCAEILSVLDMTADLSEEREGVVPIDVDSSYICGILAKAVRDNDGVIPETKQLEIKKRIECIILWVQAFALTRLYLSLETILHGNYNKLLSRKQRGVIHGSGDNR